VIDEVCSKLVLRPLITMDKRDIITLSRKIGAEEFSAAIPEYCGVISVKPSAKVKRDQVLREEEGMDPQVFEDALTNTVVQSIDEGMISAESKGERLQTAELVSELTDEYRLIDIRHQHERELKPLRMTGNIDILEIPFYKLSSEFIKLDRNQQYLLYCGKGVMSKLHAAHLFDAGYRNVGIYLPE